MAVNNVSFGNVVVVLGTPKKVDKIHNKIVPLIKRNGYDIAVKDVTAKYRNSQSSMYLAQYAQCGGKLEIYISGDDYYNMKQRKSGWDTIDGIMSRMGNIVEVSKLSLSEAVDKILNYSEKK